MLSFSDFKNEENMETEQIKNFLNDDNAKEHLANLNNEDTNSLFVDKNTNNEVYNSYKPIKLPSDNTLNYPAQQHNFPNSMPNVENEKHNNQNQKTNREHISESKLEGTIERLNHIIHLLEQQQNEKTETVVEELILYLFLGFFIIYIIDSFFRAGKYVR